MALEPSLFPPDHRVFRDPDELCRAYDAGYVGCIPDRPAWDALVGSLPEPYFEQAAPGLAGSGEGKLVLLYWHVLAFDPNAYEERQTTGDCVSHATRNAVDASRATEILVGGEAEEWVARGATEGIYGSRGHGGEGMDCAGAAKFVSQAGGLLVRKKYGAVDLSTYQGSLGAKWGPRGVPAELIAEAKKNPARHLAVIRTVAGARDALANGYALTVCSGFGFSKVRDADGFARRSGGWNHAMAWLAVDDKSERKGFLVQNSWGRWNSGPKRHGQPEGSFWIDYPTAEAMLRGGGAFALGNVDGFPRRNLPDWGTGTWL